MIAITAENTRNLMNHSAKAVTVAKDPLSKSWDKKARAKSAAVLALGPHAREDFEFVVLKVDGRWIWRPTDETTKKDESTNHAQLKANGGKRSLIPPKPIAAAQIAAATAEKVAATLAGTPAAAIATEISKVAAKDLAAVKIDRTEDPNGMPAFLKREGDNSDAARDERINRMKRTIGPERKIKNPPNAKEAKKTGKSIGGKSTSKTAMVGQLLLRKEGCTTSDILKATGWPAVSVPAQAKAVGLGLRKEKDGKITRYYGVPKK